MTQLGCRIGTIPDHHPRPRIRAALQDQHVIAQPRALGDRKPWLAMRAPCPITHACPRSRRRARSPHRPPISAVGSTKGHGMDARHDLRPHRPSPRVNVTPAMASRGRGRHDGRLELQRLPVHAHHHRRPVPHLVPAPPPAIARASSPWRGRGSGRRGLGHAGDHKIERAEGLGPQRARQIPESCGPVMALPPLIASRGDRLSWRPRA